MGKVAGPARDPEKRAARNLHYLDLKTLAVITTGKMAKEIFERTLVRAPNPSGQDAITTDQRIFLEHATGTTLGDNKVLSVQQQSWLVHVRQQILKYPPSELQSLLRQCDVELDLASCPTCDLSKKWFALLSRLAIMTANGRHISIDGALELLSQPEEELFKPEVLEAPLRNKARSLIFCCISWMTMLYPAEYQEDMDKLRIVSTQCAPIVDNQPAEHAERPICELLQDYGPLLPIKDDRVVTTTPDPMFAADSLYVSLLNADTLFHVGGIQFVWVDNISSHLLFDSEHRKLLLFRLPSFCHIHGYKSTPLSCLLDGYYDEFNKPKSFTCAAFLKEVRQSYHLIFSDESAARSLYHRRERKRLRVLGHVDIYLDELCGESANIRNERNSYSKTSDFPILASRVSVLQDYVLRQNPKSLRMIWRDKRNPAQWYTFWAVVWIGGCSLILSFVQTSLGVAQVYYAARERVA